MRVRQSLIVIAVFLCGGVPGTATLCRAQAPLAQPRFPAPRPVIGDAAVLPPLLTGPDAQVPPSSADTESLFETITGIVLDNLPEDYEDKKHWGMKKEVWRGVRFSGKPFDLKMNSRKDEVNHGTWSLYRITLVKPERWFRTRVENVRGTGSGRIGFDAIVDARVHGFARLAQWESGVQLISLSIDADADVRLRLRCEVGFRFDMADILPAVTVLPEVTDADLQLVRFDVRRISQLGGPLAHELGKGLRGVLERKIDGKRHKMIEKINRQIVKQQDKLRFSLADLGQRAWDEIADLAGR